LIYESDEKFYDLLGKPASNIKIFEYVPGAVVIGNGSPNEELLLSGTIFTNQKRTFEYVSRTVQELIEYCNKL